MKALTLEVVHPCVRSVTTSLASNGIPLDAEVSLILPQAMRIVGSSLVASGVFKEQSTCFRQSATAPADVHDSLQLKLVEEIECCCRFFSK